MKFTMNLRPSKQQPSTGILNALAIVFLILALGTPVVFVGAMSETSARTEARKRWGATVGRIGKVSTGTTAWEYQVGRSTSFGAFEILGRGTSYENAFKDASARTSPIPDLKPGTFYYLDVALPPSTLAAIAESAKGASIFSPLKEGPLRAAAADEMVARALAVLWRTDVDAGAKILKEFGITLRTGVRP